jgi:hypothetical protein
MTEQEQEQFDDLRRIVRGLAADLAHVNRLLKDHGIDSPRSSPDVMLSVSEYAKLHNRSKEAIYSRIRRGTLKAVRGPGGGWVIP